MNERKIKNRKKKLASRGQKQNGEDTEILALIIDPCIMVPETLW